MPQRNYFKITASKEDRGRRIDNFLFEQNISLSRNKIQKLIKSGNLKINNMRCLSKSYVLSGNEEIILAGTDIFDKEKIPEPQKIEISVIYEDSYLMGISKPAGMVVHPAEGCRSGTLLNALLYYNHKINPDKDFRGGIVHRLDKDTSGIILIAKTMPAYDALSRLFKERKIIKFYTALVLGSFKEKSGIIDIPIARSKKDRKKMDVSLYGRESQTEFKVLKSFKNCSLLEVQPKTGRTHQIRVHLNHIGHPIIGDKTYGNKETKILARSFGIKRHFLHAGRIIFNHPFSNTRTDITDRLPLDLKLPLESIEQTEIKMPGS